VSLRSAINGRPKAPGVLWSVLYSPSASTAPSRAGFFRIPGGLPARVLTAAENRSLAGPRSIPAGQTAAPAPCVMDCAQDEGSCSPGFMSKNVLLRPSSMFHWLVPHKIEMPRWQLVHN